MSERNRILSPSSILYTPPWAMIALIGVFLIAITGCDNAAPRGDAAGFEAPAAKEKPTGDQAARAKQLARDIKEANIVKIVGDKLYALNSYKGLLIVDVADPDNMALLGMLDFPGRGIDMYVDSGNAYIILNSSEHVPYSFGEGESAGAMPPARLHGGSKVAVVDVSNPVLPELKTQFAFAGVASQSRLVGDILYVVGNYSSQWGNEAWTNQPVEMDEGFVASINIADPANVTAVERKTFGGTSLVIHVSETAIFAASREHDYYTPMNDTNIQIIDISDLAGAIEMRASFKVPGWSRNRFSMDDFEDVFRIVTESGDFGEREVKLFTYDISDHDNVLPLGEIGIIQDGGLRAVRFDGPRGYVVTIGEPLFTLDLSHPASPTVTGALRVPGYATHIEPRGDRLIAVGIDDTDGNRPAISYYDVADPANPSQLGRVVLGPPGSDTNSDAVYDEKAFTIVDEIGLIAIPLRHWTGDRITLPADDASNHWGVEVTVNKCICGVQLIDLGDTKLTERGYFEHRGIAQRVGMIGDRLFAFSDSYVQSVDITDRDNPAKVSYIDFFEDLLMPVYKDNCDEWHPHLTGALMEPDDFFGDLLGFLQASGLCGAATANAMLAMMLTLTMVKLGSRRRRRR